VSQALPQIIRLWILIDATQAVRRLSYQPECAAERITYPNAILPLEASRGIDDRRRLSGGNQSVCGASQSHPARFSDPQRPRPRTQVPSGRLAKARTQSHSERMTARNANRAKS